MRLGKIQFTGIATIHMACLCVALVACKDKEVFFGHAEAGSPDGDVVEPGASAEQCTDPSWAPMHVGYDVTFADVWAVSPANAYAVTISGAVFRYDGNTWDVAKEFPDCQLWTVAARLGSDLVVAGDAPGFEGCTHHYDGSDWLPLDGGPTPRIHDICLTDDGALATARGVGIDEAWHYDGSSWMLLDNALVRDTGVAARSSGDAYFLGYEAANCSGERLQCDEYGHVLHFDGKNIESVRRVQNEAYVAVGLDSTSGRLFVAGYRFAPGTVEGSFVLQTDDGRDFSVTEVSEGESTLRALWVKDDSTAFLAGRGGQVYAYDGAGWSEMATGSSANLEAIHGTSKTDVFAVGSASTVLHYGCDHGQTEAPDEPPPSCEWALVLDEGDPGNITGIWVDEDHLPYVVGAGLFRFDDLAEPPVPLWSGDRTPYAVSGTGKYVFAVGESSLIVQCVSGVCTEVASPADTTLHGVFALSAVEVYAVGGEDGGSGILLSYDGQAVTSSQLPIGGPIRGIWGTSGDHLIAAGKGGIATFDGNAWRVAVPSTDELLEFYAVSGAAAHDVYVAQGTGFETVNDWGGLWHFDGSEWTELELDPSVTFYSVIAAAPDDVFAAGYRIKPVEGSNQGVVYHYDGTAWTETRGCFGAVDVVGGSAEGAFVAVNEEGLFRYAPDG